MAKLTDRTALVTPADGDFYVTTDISDTTDAATGTDKKITWANIKAALATVFASKVGTPVDNQIGVWTGDGTIEGDAALTFNTTTDTLTTGTLNSTSLTASRLMSTDGSKNIVSLSTAGYPSITEISYVKGVTSAIQTQIDAKAPIASPTFTGTLTVPVGLTGVLRADTGVVSVDSDVTDIVAAATTSAAGKVELAITSEINTGTDSTRAMPIDQFVASNRNIRYVVWRVVAPTSDWNADASTNIAGDFQIPFTGTLVSIKGDSDTAGTTGTAIVDVNLNGSTIMTTNKLKWDSTEKSTATYSGTAATLSTTAVTAGDLLTVDIDTNHTTKSKGLTITIGIKMT